MHQMATLVQIDFGRKCTRSFLHDNAKSRRRTQKEVKLVKHVLAGSPSDHVATQRFSFPHQILKRRKPCCRDCRACLYREGFLCCRGHQWRGGCLRCLGIPWRCGFLCFRIPRRILCPRLAELRQQRLPAFDPEVPTQATTIRNS